MKKISCPHCLESQRQIKVGSNASDSQRYKCKNCERKYTPEPNEIGYSQALHEQAVRLYVDGMNMRRIARHLGVSVQSVSNWVKAHAAGLPPAPVPEEVETIEMDELYTFIGDKKTESISSSS